MAPNHITSYRLFFFLEEHKEDVPQQASMRSTPTPPRPSRLRRLSSFLPSISTQPKLQEDVLRKPVPRKHFPSKFEAPPMSVPARLVPAVPASEPSSKPRSLLPRIYLQKSNVRPLSADEFLLPSINRQSRLPLLSNSYSSRSPSLALIRHGGKKQQHF
jgi:hypothetical protein